MRWPSDECCGMWCLLTTPQALLPAAQRFPAWQSDGRFLLMEGHWWYGAVGAQGCRLHRCRVAPATDGVEALTPHHGGSADLARQSPCPSGNRPPVQWHTVHISFIRRRGAAAAARGACPRAAPPPDAPRSAQSPTQSLCKYGSQTGPPRVRRVFGRTGTPFASPTSRVWTDRPWCAPQFLLPRVPNIDAEPSPAETDSTLSSGNSWPCGLGAA